MIQRPSVVEWLIGLAVVVVVMAFAGVAAIVARQARVVTDNTSQCLYWKDKLYTGVKAGMGSGGSVLFDTPRGRIHANGDWMTTSWRCDPLTEE